jgi:hypothetical protein
MDKRHVSAKMKANNKDLFVIVIEVRGQKKSERMIYKKKIDFFLLIYGC